MKYQDWMEQWLSHYVVTVVKPKTAVAYADIARNHIIPSLGGYELESLDVIELQKFVTYLLRRGNLVTLRGLSPNTVNGIITVVQGSLKTAFNLGLVPAYTANRIKRPKPSEKSVTCFTVDEQKRIVSYILSNGKYKLYGVVAAFFTGLRLGELLALTWDDVDFDKSVLSVTKTCHDAKSGRVINFPKTPSSKRAVPISKQLLPLLKKLRRSTRSLFVVSDKFGKPVSVRSYQRSFELLLAKLNIPRKCFHSIRHSFATRALEAGMDVKTLSEILGHKNASVTLNRYAHSLMEHKAEMMNRLGRLLQ